MLTEHTSAFHLFQHLNVHYFIVIICHIVSHLILSFLRRAKENICLIYLSWFVIGSCQAYSVLTKHEFQSTIFTWIVFMCICTRYHIPQEYWRVNFFFNILFFFLTFFLYILVHISIISFYCLSSMNCNLYNFCYVFNLSRITNYRYTLLINTKYSISASIIFFEYKQTKRTYEHCSVCLISFFHVSS